MQGDNQSAVDGITTIPITITISLLRRKCDFERELKLNVTATTVSQTDSLFVLYASSPSKSWQRKSSSFLRHQLRRSRRWPKKITATFEVKEPFSSNCQPVISGSIGQGVQPISIDDIRHPSQWLTAHRWSLSPSNVVLISLSIFYSVFFFSQKPASADHEKE